MFSAMHVLGRAVLKLTVSSAATWVLVALMCAGCDNHQISLGPVADATAAQNIRMALVTAEEAGAGGEQETATGTGWATIRGQFVHGGPPPGPPAPYAVTKEHHICTINGQPPPQETLIVDDTTGGIKNVAIYLRSASRVHETAQAPEEPVDFDQKHCVFLTHVFGVTIGQAVEIRNSDPTGHNTKIGGANSFNQTIPEGEVILYKPQKEEALPTSVTCSIHPWMIAYMLPRSNGYYSISDDQGRFEIANVPAGEELEFQIWHERGGAASNGLIGNAEDTGLQWDKRGRVKIRLQPDEVRELKIIVPPSAFRG